MQTPSTNLIEIFVGQLRKLDVHKLPLCGHLTPLSKCSINFSECAVLLWKPADYAGWEHFNPLC